MNSNVEKGPFISKKQYLDAIPKMIRNLKTIAPNIGIMYAVAQGNKHFGWTFSST